MARTINTGRLDVAKTSEQRKAWNKIVQIGNSMLATTDRNKLFDLFCEADDLWNEFFPFEACTKGDNWWLARRFNNIDRALAWMGEE